MAAANYITNYLPVIAALEGVVGGTLHSFLQLDVRLGLTQDFTHPSDVMLQQIFIRGWETCIPLMNVSVKTSSLQLGTLANWL